MDSTHETNTQYYDEDFLDQPRDDVYDLEDEELKDEVPNPQSASVSSVCLFLFLWGILSLLER